MTISAAIDKLFFVECGDYPFYLDCLFGNEIYEEQEEVDEARKTLADAGIELTDEILAKKESEKSKLRTRTDSIYQPSALQSN